MNASSKVSAPHLRVSNNAQESAEECAKFILESLSEALKQANRATIAISGGTTPKLLFAAMANAHIDWSNIHFFWVDERCVAPTDNQSNFKLANETLLLPAKIPGQNIHRIFGEMPPDTGAQRYVAELQQFFSLEDGQMPAFDILHRGMGPDAHTASLFPGDPIIQNRTEVAAHVWVEKLRMHRITLLPGVLLAAKCTVLQVSGLEKAEAFHHVLRDPEDLLKYPCQIASRDSKAYWFLDKLATAKL